MGVCLAPLGNSCIGGDEQRPEWTPGSRKTTRCLIPKHTCNSTVGAIVWKLPSIFKMNRLINKAFVSSSKVLQQLLASPNSQHCRLTCIDIAVTNAAYFSQYWSTCTQKLVTYPWWCPSLILCFHSAVWGQKLIISSMCRLSWCLS